MDILGYSEDNIFTALVTQPTVSFGLRVKVRADLTMLQ